MGKKLFVYYGWQKKLSEIDIAHFLNPKCTDIYKDIGLSPSEHTALKLTEKSCTNLNFSNFSFSVLKRTTLLK